MISLENPFQIASDWIDFNDCNIKSIKKYFCIYNLKKFKVEINSEERR